MKIFQVLTAVMVSLVVKVKWEKMAPRVTLDLRVWWDLQDSMVKRERKVRLVTLVKRVPKVGNNFAVLKFVHKAVHITIGSETLLIWYTVSNSMFSRYP
jgi:hypothetical protein